ncbi:hypothetical protein A2Z33_06350 [Candidatus Gottesmanbacteria bacterium RBG_16_52_11]|uniref:EfeO-type cupredoxin-like domain-containing protein n=1 Tax=Candidatus Gottesmanbacteria bacterium RBG_16_52_11 TaxID=1798374 RepID=A0A1F5YYB9_9BACT|nr:MAG: hypothetical protein A2Z33_06350 [Candidatus Gottesmanbacteria bacterium RBG_16_52_11]
MDEIQTGSSGISMPAVVLGVVAVIALIGLGIMFTRGTSPAVNPQDDNAIMVREGEPSPAVTTTDGSDRSGAAVNPTGTDTMTEEQGVNVEVEAGSFYYKPNVIRAKIGVPVTIVLTAADAMHDFNIDELDVSIPVTKSGSSSTVTFTPDRTGEFEYYCSVGQHRQNGQVGKLIVGE